MRCGSCGHGSNLAKQATCPRRPLLASPFGGRLIQVLSVCSCVRLTMTHQGIIYLVSHHSLLRKIQALRCIVVLVLQKNVMLLSRVIVPVLRRVVEIAAHTECKVHYGLHIHHFAVVYIEPTA